MSNMFNHASSQICSAKGDKAYSQHNSMQRMQVPEEKETIEVSFRIIAPSYFPELFPGLRPIFQGYVMIIEGKCGESITFRPYFGSDTERNLKFLGALHSLHYVFGFHPHLYVKDITKYVMVFLTPEDIPVTEQQCISFFELTFLPHFKTLYPNIDQHLVPCLASQPTDYISQLSEILDNTQIFELVEAMHFPSRKEIAIEDFIAQRKHGKYIVLYSFWGPGTINLEIIEKYKLSTDYLHSSDEFDIISEVMEKYRLIAKELKKFDIHLIHKTRGFDVTLTRRPTNAG